jgi:hypothetical protein
VKSLAGGLLCTITGGYNATHVHLLGAVAKQLFGHAAASNSHVNLLALPSPQAFVDTAVGIISRL